MFCATTHAAAPHWSCNGTSRRVAELRMNPNPAHSQGDTLDELRRNLQEVLEMLLEDGEPKVESEFIGIQTIQVA